MKKKTKIIIGILIAAVIAAAGITWYVMNQKNQKTGNSSAEVVAWDVDIEEEEPSQEKGILIPGYTSMVMKANTKEQTVSIGNPADNDCIFVIVLKLEDGTKLFESQELKPAAGQEATDQLRLNRNQLYNKDLSVWGGQYTGYICKLKKSGIIQEKACLENFLCRSFLYVFVLYQFRANLWLRRQQIM